MTDTTTLLSLPFNNAGIAGSFVLCHPSSPADAAEGHWVILSGDQLIVAGKESADLLPFGQLPEQVAPQRPLQIGYWQDRPVRTFSISSSAPLPPAYRKESFNAADEVIPPDILSLAGVAKQILHWERNSRHCARCGSSVSWISGTWGRQCDSCRATHFPHIHPCAIVLVRRGDQLLLTRKPGWLEGRYSLVAGFLDFGESLEECAVREVKEETGIEICNVRYLGSQNWPFPAQLMAGFVADYAGGEISIDREELEDARWFPLDSLPLLPSKRSIARWIIDQHTPK